MARPPRVFIPGIAVHIVQRGNNHSSIFHRRQDYLRFLDLLRFAVADTGITVHAYALMTTHVHLVVTPEQPSSIPRAMQKVGMRYVLYFNRAHQRIGTLWNGRYRAKLIDDERYCLTCLRYVDCNPLRAAMVADPADYEWSSYRAHALGEWTELLTPHPLYLALGKTHQGRQMAYRALCNSGLNADQLAAIRSSRPFRAE